MPHNILYEDRFGEEKEAGVVISSNEEDGELYEVIALYVSVVTSPTELARLEHKLNVDCREGYAIYPLKNCLGEFVWYHYRKGLVLCLARGLWG